MARNISPSAAGNHWGIEGGGFAVGLRRLPLVARVFASGDISEPAARAVVREATGLDREQAVKFDRRIAIRLRGMTPRNAADLARSITISIDSQAAYERAEANRRDSFVSLFPDRDGVAVLQVRGRAEQMLAAFNALKKSASALLADGDPRTKGQIMIDTLVRRVTGLEIASGGGGGVGGGVEIGLVMTVGSLIHTDEMPAILAGYGPIPPELAHDLISEADKSWIRRPFVDPVDGHLIDQDSRRRLFDRPLARFISGRDVRCRQPGRGYLPARSAWGKMHPSGRPIISAPMPMSARPEPPTVRVSAPDLTRSNISRAGLSAHTTTRSPGRPPQATATDQHRRRSFPATAAHPDGCANRSCVNKSCVNQIQRGQFFSTTRMASSRDSP